MILPSCTRKHAKPIIHHSIYNVMTCVDGKNIYLCSYIREKKAVQPHTLLGFECQNLAYK